MSVKTNKTYVASIKRFFTVNKLFLYKNKIKLRKYKKIVIKNNIYWRFSSNEAYDHPYTGLEVCLCTETFVLLEDA